MDEELIVSYDDFSEANESIQKHLSKGFLLLRHNSNHKKIFFKKPKKLPTLTTHVNEI